MHHCLRLFLLILLWLSIVGNVTAEPEPNADTKISIGIVTMDPGDIFFERFGHNAIVVIDPTTGEATSYNFGFFDPSEPGFIPRFIHGHMMYYLVAMPFEQDMLAYEYAGRDISIQWLNLTTEQAQQMVTLLEDRVKPENARYRYDYFNSNCATEIRDVLNTVMSGSLKQQLTQQPPRNTTYRSEVIRLAAPEWWMRLGFDLGLGPYADQPLTPWQDAFIPAHLANSLNQTSNNQGQPLLLRTTASSATAPTPPALLWPWLLVGLPLALVLAHRWIKPATYTRLLLTLAIPFWLFCGVTGLLLAYLWGFTEHNSAWANQNLLLLNPLCLVLIPGAIKRFFYPKMTKRFYYYLLWAIVSIASLSIIIHLLPLPYQHNEQWIAPLLLCHILLAYGLNHTHPLVEPSIVRQDTYS